MNFSRLPVRLAALPLALCAAWPPLAVAQTLSPTVVTATRTAQPLADLVADVSIIERAEIERSGATGVAELLARQSGIQVVRSGPPGSASSVFVRGTDSRHTAVYIDGVRVDSQSVGGAQWEQLPLAQIERIEVLRGPAAAVYGSDAVGGVIQLFTKKAEPGRPAPFVGVGAGSQRSWRLEAGISGRAGHEDAFDYTLGVSKERSRGFNAQPDHLRGPFDPPANPDRDGYERLSGNARLGWQLHRDHRLDATLLASQLTSQYDGYGWDPAAPSDDRNHNRLRTAGLGWSAQWTPAFSTRVQLGDTYTRYASTPDPYRTETRLRDASWRSEYRRGVHLFSATLERRDDALVNGAIDNRRHQNALALGYGLNTGPHALQLNLRRDDDSEFGGQTTGSAAYGYAITPAWRATVSVASSFRAPTLYQRLSEYGVANLRPEQGRNVEAGLRWTEGASSAGVVVYRNRLRNLINFGGAGACASPFGCYENVGRAQYQGVTLSGHTRVGMLRVRASLDWQDPQDRSSGQQLARRARQYAMLGAEGDWAGWSLGAELQASGRRYDDAANTTRLGGYALLNLYASRQLARDFTLTARVDNLADKDYQTARQYATEGRVFWLGLKWAPH